MQTLATAYAQIAKAMSKIISAHANAGNGVCAGRAKRVPDDARSGGRNGVETCPRAARYVN